MAFREVIEAVLRVKDANRFKAGMEGAARSVRKLGRDEEQTAARTELLKKIQEGLERQTLELTAALRLNAAAIDNVGDQAVGAAARMVVLNRAMKQSGGNAVFLGKSWAFWKDRLSLTRSELTTTALTVSAYFMPAIIALGSSFAYAAIGGGGVAAGGLSTLLFGLGLLSTVMAPVLDQMDKITKAQDQFTQTVNEFGATSMEASRANAHLYGVIKTQGGKPVLDAANAVRKLKTEWAGLTGPARGDLLGALMGGVGAARNMMPTLATAANGMAQGLRAALKDAFSILDSNDLRETFRTLAITFDQAVGPAARGFANLLIVVGRVIRATAPWVVKWAQAWERTTLSWKRGTRDSGKLSRFFDEAVSHFKAWWGLAKELGRTLRIIFGASTGEGLKVVGVLTNLVRRFNDWLGAANDTGRIERFWQRYNQLLKDTVWALGHPGDAINKYMPAIMTAIANWVTTHAGSVATMFVKAFLDANAWVKFLTLAALLKKFGFFSALGGKSGTSFVGAFLRSFIATAAPGLTAFFAAEGTLAKAMAAAGRSVGRGFGKGFVAGAVLGIVLFGDDMTEAAAKKLGSKHPKDFRILDNAWKMLQSVGPSHWRIPHPGMPGGALGGIIPQGGSAFVGERGPELAVAGPQGTAIRPLAGNSRHTLGVPDIPNIEDRLRITVHSYVHVDKREIANAVDNYHSYEAARRGGRPPERRR